MSAEKRFSQDWNAPGVYRDVLIALVEEYKPPAAILKKIVENMNANGYQFTYRGLEYCFFFCLHLLVLISGLWSFFHAVLFDFLHTLPY